MWHVGIDLHRRTIVLAAVNDGGEAMNPITIPCADTAAIINTARALGPFRAVIEATGTYRWLYDLLHPCGTILLAHPFRLRAMIQRRTKTDKLDAQLLANLLRINQIPLAYIPSEPYQRLRDLVRCRARLGRELAEAKIQLRGLLARHNREAPFRVPFGVRGLAWFGSQDFGIGLFSAPLIVAELGEVERFRTAKQVGAYSGLTSRVHQSGAHCHRGSISRQGSPWLRWILVEAAMKTIREDAALKNFYTRVRKRSSAKIARVAAARKLAEICWKRLRRWQREHVGKAA